MAAEAGQGADTGARSRPLGMWTTGFLIVFAVAVLLVPVEGAGWRGVGVAVLAALTAAAFALQAAAGIRALVFVDLAFLIFTAGAIASWPDAVTATLVCVVPLAGLLGCNAAARLRPAAPWLRPGRPTVAMVALGLATITLAAGVLTLWAMAVRPEPSPYLRGLQQLPWWLALAGVVGFALVNSLWEESLFRGVILQELTTAWGVGLAIVVQAVVFGAAHWAGFPSGWLGMAMAACWGLVLGVLRVRTGGILLPYVVHVCADAVIGTLALVLLR